MTPAQPSLFESVIDSGTARRSDRWSSREAARRTRPAKAKADVLAALEANGGRGTVDTVDLALPMLRNSISRRLTDLCEDGVIRATGEHVEGVYGRPVAVWEVVR